MNIMKRLVGSLPSDDLKHLAQRRQTLEARKEKAIAALDAARDARKAALVADGEAELVSVTAAVRDATDVLDTIVSVLADLEEEAVAAEARLAVAQEADARTKAAKDLTSYAEQYEAAAVSLDAALKTVAKAYSALVAAVPETLVVTNVTGLSVPADELARPGPTGLFALQLDYPGPARSHDLARIVLAEGLAKVCPSVFGYTSEAQHYRSSLHRASALDGHPTVRHADLTGLELLSAREAATALVSNRLRTRAAAIATGELPPALIDRSPVEPVKRKRAEKTPAEVMVFATSSFAFRLYPDRNLTPCGGNWVHSIPEDAAELAVRKGVALRIDSPEGERAFDNAKAQKGIRGVNNRGMLHIDDCHNIGVIRATPDDEDA